MIYVIYPGNKCELDDWNVNGTIFISLIEIHYNYLYIEFHELHVNE